MKKGRRPRPPAPIIIRHKYNGRFVRAYNFGGSQYVIGSTRKSAIRLLTPDIAGVVCVLENRKGRWTLSDSGSQPDVKINGKSFVEYEVKDKTSLQIGKHTLEFYPCPPPHKIFGFEEKRNSTRGKVLTVIKLNGRVILSSENEHDADFARMAENKAVEVVRYFMAPQPVLQRGKIELPKEMKKPTGVVSGLMAILVFFSVFFGLPIKKQEEKPPQNLYTRMIYDSKILAQRKKAVAGFAPRSDKGTGAGNGSISEGAKGGKSTSTKVISSLRKAGVQSMISKIASRASKSATLIASLAATPQADASVQKGFGEVGGAPSNSAATGKSGLVGNGKGFQIGGIGTGGKGGGVGGYKAGSGLGTGNIGNGEVGLDDEESVIDGGLDRDVIAGVIKQHIGQIKYCYERQLSANPDLYGKIKVQFSIDSDGLVNSQSIGQSTLKSALVEECILRRIATWKFPKPKGGTKVLVSYPFLFKSAN